VQEFEIPALATAAGAAGEPRDAWVAPDEEGPLELLLRVTPAESSREGPPGPDAFGDTRFHGVPQ